MVKAWVRLDEKFGDKQQNIISLHDRLIELEVPKGREYDQIEYLAYNIDCNMHMLEELGAASSVISDLRMVSTMLSKLPAPARSRWSRWCNGQSVTPGLNEWEFFRRWLEEEKQAALREKRHDRMINKQDSSTTTPNQATSKKPPMCSRCNKPGHSSATCVLPGSLADINYADYETEEAQICAAIQGIRSAGTREEEYRKTKEKFGKCCHCSKHHIYKRNVLGEEIDWPSCKLISCPAFMKLSSAEKGAVVESSGACPRCLSWRHVKEEQCGRRPPSCDKLTSGSKCKRAHHSLLYESHNVYCEASSLSIVVAATVTCPVVLLEI